MKQITVKACVRITAYRCIITHHISGDGVTTKDERVEEDDPIVVQVHELQLQEDVSSDGPHQEKAVLGIPGSSVMKAVFPALNQQNEKKLSVLSEEAVGCYHSVSGEELSENMRCNLYVTADIKSPAKTGPDTCHEDSHGVSQLSSLENDMTHSGNEHAFPQQTSPAKGRLSRTPRRLHKGEQGQRVKKKMGKLKSNVSQAKTLKSTHKDQNNFGTRKSTLRNQKRPSIDQEKETNKSCEVCNTKFKSENLLRLHISKYHNCSDTLSCSLCDRKFSSVSGLKKHKNNGTCTQSYTCEVCGKIFDNSMNRARDSYTKHMNNHKLQAGGTKFTCEKCGRVYMNNDSLKKHEKSHQGIKPYSCKECGKSFALAYMVRDHMRIHTGAKPFLCNICGQSFSMSGHLARHLKSHSKGTLNKRGRRRKNIQEFKEAAASEAVRLSEHDANYASNVSVQEQTPNNMQSPYAQEYRANDIQTPTPSHSLSATWVQTSEEQDHTMHQRTADLDNMTKKSFMSNNSSLYHIDQCPTSAMNCDQPLTPCITQLTPYSGQHDLRGLQETDNFHPHTFSQYQHNHAENRDADYQEISPGPHAHEANVIAQPLHQLHSSFTQQTSQVDNDSNRKWPTHFPQYPLETSSVIPVPSHSHSCQIPIHRETTIEHHHQ